MTLPGTFESTPSSPVTTLRRGPLGSLIAGFANGALGMWTWRNAKLLILDRLHGPVAHVLLEGQKLYVASDLGDHLYWDLSPFFSDSCIILNQMWSTVPVIWRQGMAVAAAAPGSHKCLKKKR